MSSIRVLMVALKVAFFVCRSRIERMILPVPRKSAATAKRSRAFTSPSVSSPLELRTLYLNFGIVFISIQQFFVYIFRIASTLERVISFPDALRSVDPVVILLNESRAEQIFSKKLCVHQGM